MKKKRAKPYSVEDCASINPREDMVWELSQRTSQNGSEHNKDRDIATAIEECCDKYFTENTQELSSADFYAAVCKTVEEINKKLNSTQFRVSDKEKLKQVYNVLEEIMIGAGFTGFGSFALFIKQRIAPTAVPNDVFIPGITLPFLLYIHHGLLYRS
ncbi:unnamed protein product [Linum tenue]|uniref:Uncharacterized protein n=1 Tax=Linum tenue TaxID=586396 RepID=A0AAV0QEG2_9ROSI|nr:unnamed protein product [Linum tenue]